MQKGEMNDQMPNFFLPFALQQQNMNGYLLLSVFIFLIGAQKYFWKFLSSQKTVEECTIEFKDTIINSCGNQIHELTMASNSNVLSCTAS